MKELLKQPKKISDKEIDKIILDDVLFNHRLYEINYKIYKKMTKKIENQE